MSIIPSVQPDKPPGVPADLIPDYDQIVIDDGKPVDGIYSERQMRLLTQALYASWSGPGGDRPFMALANVGLFYAMREPPVVPDVMVILDVQVGDLTQKRYNSYFLWEYGRRPDVVVEIVSNQEGGELGRKRAIYEQIGIPYYLVWDPSLFLGDRRLHVLKMDESRYRESGRELPAVGLSVIEWRGVFEGHDDTWLRWCDSKGQVIPTGAERAEQESRRAEQERERAEQERSRAEQERERADRLAEKLRSLGVDPDAP